MIMIDGFAGEGTLLFLTHSQIADKKRHKQHKIQNTFQLLLTFFYKPYIMYVEYISKDEMNAKMVLVLFPEKISSFLGFLYRLL